MKRLIICYGLIISNLLNGITNVIDTVYHSVQKDLRKADYSQMQLLSLLESQKEIKPKERRSLTRENHKYIRDIVTLLGLRSELDGYLDSKAFSVFKSLPPEIMIDCCKAMQRTWTLDKEFCYRYLPVDVYALPHDKLIEIQDSTKKAKLLPSMLIPEFSKPKCEREAELKRRSSFVFELPYNVVRTQKGKLFNRLEKRCTVDDCGYIEIVNLNKLKWQELYFLHELALINQQSMNGKVVTNYCANVSAAYKTLDSKHKKNFETPPVWYKKIFRFFKNDVKASSFDLRLQEIELS